MTDADRPTVDADVDVDAARRAPRRRRDARAAIVFDVEDLTVYYGAFRAVRDVDLAGPPARDHRVHRPVGLRQDHGAALLQPHERPDRDRPGSRASSPTTASTSTTATVNPVEVRRRIGMVFQKPNPFPKSIYDNVAYGPRLAGCSKKGELDDVVERVAARRRAVGRGEGPAEGVGAWASRAASSSGCASPGPSPCEPEVILMDEPCSALDPIATGRIEDLMQELKAKYTIVIVTHNMQQAARVSDRTRVLHHRGQRRRATAAPACSSSTTGPRRSSRTPPTSAPRTTSPAGSAEPDGRERARRRRFHQRARRASSDEMTCRSSMAVGGRAILERMRGAARRGDLAGAERPDRRRRRDRRA